MAELNVSLPGDLQRYVDERVLAEGFADPEAFMRDLIQRDHDRHAIDIRHVRALWLEGVGSRVLDDEPEDIVEQIIAEIPARNAAA